MNLLQRLRSLTILVTLLGCFQADQGKPRPEGGDTTETPRGTDLDPGQPQTERPANNR